MKEQLEAFQRQHLNNYKMAVAEVIHNNTHMLVEEDILSFFKEPPIDSMDMLRNKFLSTAKEMNLVLSTERLKEKIGLYREHVQKDLQDLCILREKAFSVYVDTFEEKKNNSVIRVPIKQINACSKEMRGFIDDVIIHYLKEDIIENLETFIVSDLKYPAENTTLFITTMTQYLLIRYPDQVMSGIRARIVVKNNTLLSGMKEQGKRYLFTKKNSHLLRSN